MERGREVASGEWRVARKERTSRQSRFESRRKKEIGSRKWEEKMRAANCATTRESELTDLKIGHYSATVTESAAGLPSFVRAGRRRP
jgi:hypothetical protein